MSASTRTVIDTYLVLQKHVPDRAKRTKLLADLTGVKGNKSFMQTVETLAKLHDRLMVASGEHPAPKLAAIDHGKETQR